ncbi:MAG: arylesterase [Methylohalobius crimeensis]
MGRIGLFLLWMLLPQLGWTATVLVMGDSLSAAYGIPADRGWVALLEERLQKEHKDVRFVNASISGETSAGGLRRLPPLLETHQPDIVILELGGNDGLRGIPPRQMERNLANMIEASRSAGAEVILLGIKMPTNYGPRFAAMFEDVYQRLADRHPVTFVPFFLQDVALKDGLMQADGIHPNVEAQPLLAQEIWHALNGMID